MENKKLLKYLLKDLTELDEMFATENKTSFDEMEIEFVRNRVSGAKKLVKLYLEKLDDNEKIEPVSAVEITQKSERIDFIDKTQNEDSADEKQAEETFPREEKPVTEENNEKEESKSIIKPAEKILVTDDINKKENLIKADVVEEISESEKSKAKTLNLESKFSGNIEGQVDNNNEIQLEEEELVNVQGKRLGDSFFKEKSVNDSMSDDFSKLEHKLSNRPVTSIKTSIGINDKFQYIRELFEGSAESFTKAVEELDGMNNLNDAVQYLQTNYKWKKNDTSLKFVNLIKRRFSNE